jgi:PTS system nitrogen regulatory IIA component
MTEFVTGLRAADKGALLAELARLAAPAAGAAPAELLRLLAAREALGSTGTGGGIAVPHARVPGLATPVSLLALLARPVAFDAIDGRPVDLVFLLLSPVQDHGRHLALLAAASRRLRDGQVVAWLRTAEGADALAAAFGEG